MTSLTHPSEVRDLLRMLDFTPSKSLGQNFLVDRNILTKILDAADITPGDIVLEIGPGLGVLTEGLLERGAHVVAVERDRRLYDYLSERMGRPKDLELIHADILKFDLRRLQGMKVTRLVSNLPYSIGTRALIECVELSPSPQCMVVTVQLDVAERLAAQADTKAYGTVSVLAQSRYDVRLESIISPTCFYPPPRVTSAILKLNRLTSPPWAPADRRHFRSLVKWAFLHRRKQFGSMLHVAPPGIGLKEGSQEAFLEQLGLDGQRRPGTLSVGEWCALSNALVAARERR